MKSILYIGSEALPFAATGGLGDVMGSLPKAIKAQSPETDVRAVMPLYDAVKPEWREKMTFEKYIFVDLAWRHQYCGIFSLTLDGVKWYFIDNEYYFKRGRLYGEYDDAERFAFFSVAALELMRAVGFYPDVMHCNDWQTALAVILLKRRYEKFGEYGKVRAFYTVHNIDYQGEFNHAILGDVFSLEEKDRSTVDYAGAINLTKGAIVCADFVTTVSPRYAREIQTDYFAQGLAPITRSFGFKIDGVINGIDTEMYDPRTDKEIPKNFSWRGLSGKAVCKTEMQKRLGLPVRSDVPVVAMISRLVEHKGFDLVKCIADELLASDDIQIALLGTGERETEEYFRGLAARHPDKAGVVINYDRHLSKLIYAGADMFLMPSKREACGLAQMIASRYGTVPIVHDVGGLHDTIVPYSAGGNGFVFIPYNAHDMMYTIRDAERLYADREEWQRLVKKIMRIDFSWEASAKKYAALYERNLTL